MNAPVKTPAHKDTRNDHRHPRRLLPAVSAIAGRSPITPSEEQERIVGCLWSIVTAGAQGTGVLMSDCLPRAHLTVYLASLACGAKESAALKEAGLNWVEINYCEVVDRDGFGRLLKKARELKAQAFAERCLEKAEAIVDGVDEPIIGKVGGGRDGILRDDDGRKLYRKRYYERMVMFALERLDKKRFGQPMERGAVNVGNNITYNITLGGAERKPPIVPQVIEADVLGGTPPELGGNLAEIAEEC